MGYLWAKFNNYYYNLAKNSLNIISDKTVTFGLKLIKTNH